MAQTWNGESVVRILLVGGSPEGARGSDLIEAAKHADHIVAVDGGLDAILHAGLEPDLFCGDADSVSAEASAVLERVERDGGSWIIERYATAKDYSDLTLALRAIAHRWSNATICASRLVGGRPDHALCVIGQLASWEGSVELVEDSFEGRMLRAGECWEISEDMRGRTFSFMPLALTNTVTETGMRWELHQRTCGLLEDIGISNIIEGAARITCHEGRLICWLFRNE
ncbi:thiamine diphosphokinase [Collinsella sp. AGMB00827]|uniref:Thiamine diphosphokinase n=1 Tax=Collinsella ureilytica TaxID=2869515 RepID=A0ABS7MHI7_9ACTN|nr:thiamine diphosphokinase [Collinsella urealyticum]MBY4796827.1 thiamine diphosphokinase [Collinsella urealyticum]